MIRSFRGCHFNIKMDNKFFSELDLRLLGHRDFSTYTENLSVHLSSATVERRHGRVNGTTGPRVLKDRGRTVRGLVGQALYGGPATLLDSVPQEYPPDGGASLSTSTSGPPPSERLMDPLVTHVFLEIS